MNSSRPDIITILEETLDNLELGTVTSLSLVKVLWNYQTIEFKFDIETHRWKGVKDRKPSLACTSPQGPAGGWIWTVVLRIEWR